MNSMRFNWIRDCRNTLWEVMSTWRVSHAIAAEIQHSIAMGCTEKQANAIAKASRELCEQVGF